MEPAHCARGHGDGRGYGLAAPSRAMAPALPSLGNAVPPWRRICNPPTIGGTACRKVQWAVGPGDGRREPVFGREGKGIYE